jgi:hypothetical protein
MADEQQVWAINEYDSVLHVGCANDLLAHLSGEELKEFEIYDSLGRRMKKVNSGGGEPSFVLIDEREPGPSDKQLLLDRISSALARIQVRVDRHPEDAPKDQRVPVVQSDLKVVLAALGASAFSELLAGAEETEARPGLGGTGEGVLDNRGTRKHNCLVHGHC